MRPRVGENQGGEEDGGNPNDVNQDVDFVGVVGTIERKLIFQR